MDFSSLANKVGSEIIQRHGSTIDRTWGRRGFHRGLSHLRQMAWEQDFRPLGQGGLSVGQAGGRGGLRADQEIHHLRSSFYLDCRDGSDRGTGHRHHVGLGAGPALGGLRFDPDWGGA